MKPFLRIVTLIMFISLAGGLAFSQDFSSGLNVYPRTSIPIGEYSLEYKAGIGVEMEGLFSLSALPWLNFGPIAGYQFIPLELQQEGFPGTSNLSLIDYGLILKSGFSFAHMFALSAGVKASAYNALLHGDVSQNAMGFCWGVRGGFDVLLSNSFTLQAGFGYSSYYGLRNSFDISIGASTRLTGQGNSLIPRKDFVPAGLELQPVEGNIEFFDVKIETIFPVLYKYYFDQPVGTATVLNNGDETLTNTQVRLSLSQHMDSPKLSASIAELPPGEKTEVELYLLLTGSVLSITEGAKLAGELQADYFIGKRPGIDSRTVVVETYHRNAMRWDDDQKIAAFITSRDEEIQRYARNIASIVRELGIKGMSNEFQKGMAYLEAMNIAGITYVVDPGNSYKEMSANAFAVDTIQFPRQTIEYKAGDCDDMTVTYAALLESVGIETGFITVPGHIFSAFRLNITRADARQAFSAPEKLIYIDDQVWLPVETTALTEGFIKAWEMGAAQWYRYAEEDKSRLFPTREAWSTYQPVAFEVSDHKLEQIDSGKLIKRVAEELKNFVDDEIAIKQQELTEQLAERPGNPRILNRMGVLLARYDRNEEAMSYFKQAAEDDSYLPALVNMGNIAFLQEDYYTAGSYYQQVLNTRPSTATAILGLARVSHSLNDFVKSKTLYSELKDLSPELAAQYAYLASGADNGNRNSDMINFASSISWDLDDLNETE